MYSGDKFAQKFDHFFGHQVSEEQRRASQRLEEEAKKAKQEEITRRVQEKLRLWVPNERQNTCITFSPSPLSKKELD